MSLSFIKLILILSVISYTCDAELIENSQETSRNELSTVFDGKVESNNEAMATDDINMRVKRASIWSKIWSKIKLKTRTKKTNGRKVNRPPIRRYPQIGTKQAEKVRRGQNGQKVNRPPIRRNQNTESQQCSQRVFNNKNKNSTFDEKASVNENHIDYSKENDDNQYY